MFLVVQVFRMITRFVGLDSLDYILIRLGERLVALALAVRSRDHEASVRQSWKTFCDSANDSFLDIQFHQEVEFVVARQ